MSICFVRAESCPSPGLPLILVWRWSLAAWPIISATNSSGFAFPWQNNDGSSRVIVLQGTLQGGTRKKGERGRMGEPCRGHAVGSLAGQGTTPVTSPALVASHSPGLLEWG